MKRFTAILVSLFCVVLSFASGNVSDDAITMVSYEQSWLDSNGTLALKNNTNEKIYNVVFQITYLDMSGKDLDYEVFSRRIDIEPGMTRKVDIPAYEHERNYHYYKTKDEFKHPAFKIKFTLKDYNVKSADKKNSVSKLPSNDLSDEEDSSDFIYGIIGLLAVLVFISICIGSYVLVAVMAQKRNRSVVAWVLLSIIATPLLMVIILLCIGSNNKNTFD